MSNHLTKYIEKWEAEADKRAAGSSASACWPDDRAEELKVLRKLLETVAGLNNGSGFLESVRWCITTAERLRYSDIAGLRLSFLNHLECDCIAEREANVGLDRPEGARKEG